MKGENGNPREEWELIFFASLLSLGFLGIPTGALIWSAVKYAIWKKWANERGWEEEIPKEK